MRYRIEMGAGAADISKTIQPHPTLGESIDMATTIAQAFCPLGVSQISAMRYFRAWLCQGVV